MEHSVVKRIIRGCGYLNGFGHHPGWRMLIILSVMGALQMGSLHGWEYMWIGGITMFIPMLLPFFIGAHSRAKLAEEREAKAFETLKG